MEKQRLDNIENTLSQLISMVGSMRAEMKHELTGVKEEQSGMKQEIAGMKHELTGVKEEQFGMKQEIAGMKHELTGVKEEQSGMKQEIAGLNQKQTSFSGELKSIKENLADSKKTNDKRHREIMNEFKIFRADQDLLGKRPFKTNVILLS